MSFGFRKVLAVLMVLAAAFTSVLMGVSAAHAAARAFSVRYQADLEGGAIRVAGNSWLTCSTTSGFRANTCEAAKSYTAVGIENSNNTAAGSRTMVPNDVDGVASTVYSSSSTLTLEPGAVVEWAGLYWSNTGSSIPAVLIDTPGSAGIDYVTVASTQSDSIAPYRAEFADITAQVRAGGEGLYTVAPSGGTPSVAAGWAMVVVYSVPGGVDRTVAINDGLVQRNASGRTDVTFSGFTTPPTGNVGAQVATVIYDPDAGYLDNVQLGNDATSLQLLPNPGPIANDYANASVRNFNVKPDGGPDDANNFSIDAKVVETTNFIGNGRTSAVARFSTGNEIMLPAVIGIAVDNYVVDADLTKSFVDENGGDVEPGDVLRFVIEAQGTGSEAVTLATISDALPAGLEYVPGSIEIAGTSFNAGAKTDASGDDQGEYDPATRTVSVRLGEGATATAGGRLLPRPDSPVQSATFRARVPTTITEGEVTNGATLTGAGSETGNALVRSASATFTPVLLPALTLVKSATLQDQDGDDAADAGESVTYAFTVTNSGNTQLSGLAVADPTLGTVSCTPTTLEPGQEATCSAPTRQVTQADVDRGDALTNTAEASASAPNGIEVSDDDSTSTPVTDGGPELRLTKVANWDDADGDDALDVGESVAYSFLVENTGEVSATDITVSDVLAGPVTCDATFLAPGASTSCTAADYVLTADDEANGTLVNTATASGTSARGGAVTSNEASTTTPSDPAPALVLEKVAIVDPPERQDAAAAGDTITYTFRVTNSGNVPLDTVAVSDASLGAVDCPTTQLSPGESMTCTAPTRTVTQDDIDAGAPLTNTATVAGTARTGGEVTAQDSTSTPVAAASPALSLTKSAAPQGGDGDGALEAGERVAFTFLLENTGNVMLDTLAVQDPKVGSVTCPVTSLAPGGSTTCRTDEGYVVTQEDVDAGVVTNTATATASTPGGAGVVSPSSSTRTPTVAPDPALTLTKSATLDDGDGDGAADVGERIAYEFSVRNTGTVTLTGISVVDPLLGADPIACSPTTIAPDSVATCSTSRTRAVTQDDVDAGSLSNTATASGIPPGGGSVTDEDSVTVAAVPAAPVLVLDKTAAWDDADGDGRLDVGEQITYSLVLTNSGNVTLTDVAVSDPMLGAVTCPADTLAPGAAETCTARAHTVTQADVDAGRVVNTATATATAARGANPTSSDAAIVPGPSPAAVELVKTATVQPTEHQDAAEAGDTVIYTFAATNTGSVTLSEVTVQDPGYGPVTCDRTTLAPGESTACTASVVRTVGQDDVDAGRPLTNTATVTGAGLDGTEVTDEASTSTPVVAASPALALTKSAEAVDSDGDGGLEVGEQVEFSFVLENPGNVTLDTIAVQDPMAGEVSCPVSTLAPGASTTCRADTAYVVTQADVDAGAVRNTAAAAAFAPGDVPVVAEPSSTRTPTAPPAPEVALEKSGVLVGDTVLDEGDTVEWSFTVTNTGNVSLSEVTLVDERLDAPAFCEATVLAPGESTACAGTHQVTAAEEQARRVENTAMVSALAPGSPVALVAEDSAQVEGDTPAATAPSEPTPAEPTQPPTSELAQTGAVVLPPLAAALTALLAGAVLVLIRRHRV